MSPILKAPKQSPLFLLVEVRSMFGINSFCDVGRAIIVKLD
jgi:hypothetical protein